MAGSAVVSKCSPVALTFSISDGCIGKLTATNVIKHFCTDTEEQKMLDVHGQDIPIQINEVITNVEKRVSSISLSKLCP